MAIAYRLIVDDKIKEVLNLLIKRCEETSIFGFAKFKTAIYILSNAEIDNQDLLILDLYFPMDIIFPNLIKRLAFRVRMKQIKYTYKFKYISKDRMIRLVLDNQENIRIYDGT